MDYIDALKDVRSLLSDPVHWTKGTLAANRYGSASVGSSSATCFCLIGAIYRRVGYRDDLTSQVIINLNRTIHKKHGISSITRFNDRAETTHEMVLDVLDQTIAQAEKTAAEEPV